MAMSGWFTETSVLRPTGDWRWRIGVFSSRPILQILVRRECSSAGTSWMPAQLAKYLPPVKPKNATFEYCWRDVRLQDLSSAELRPLMSGRRSEASLGYYPAIRSNFATILVNGKPHTVSERALTATDIVALVHGPNPDRVLSGNVAITARDRGAENARTLAIGETVEARDGLILNVVTADGPAPN
jgi:hypothetical protein